MAIIFQGVTKCPICNQVLEEGSYVMFPPFASNVNDTLFIFSDQGVHIQCLNHHPLGKKALYFKEMYDNALSRRSQIVSKGLIEPRNIISFPMLTSNESEGLYKFNFLILDKARLNDWEEKEEFLKIAKKWLSTGKWKSFTDDFNLLEFLIKEVE